VTSPSNKKQKSSTEALENEVEMEELPEADPNAGVVCVGHNGRQRGDLYSAGGILGSVGCTTSLLCVCPHTPQYTTRSRAGSRVRPALQFTLSLIFSIRSTPKVASGTKTESETALSCWGRFLFLNHWGQKTVTEPRPFVFFKAFLPGSSSTPAGQVPISLPTSC